MSHQCRPASDVFVNPGKQAAMDIAGSIPVIWGTSPLTGVVAYRFASQLAVSAKYPAISGELPEVNHNQLLTFDGTFAAEDAATTTSSATASTSRSPGLRLVVVRRHRRAPPGDQPARGIRRAGG